MNSRIFKKLTKAASIEIDRLNIRDSKDRFEVDYENPDVDISKSYKWEKKSLQRNSRFPIILGGTIGYGAMFGYYDPEWEENDALSILFNFAFGSFTEWKYFDHDSQNWPENNCPKKLKTSARHLINYAKQLTRGCGDGTEKAILL